jgi:hypothetical protein
MRPGPLTAALAALAIAAPAVAEVHDPACGSSRLVVREGGLLYRLPHGFLRAGTDTVRGAEGPLVDGTDYVLDRLRGELRLLRARPAGETLRVDACRLLSPPPLSLQLLRYRPPPAAAADSAPPVALAPAPRPAVARDPGAGTAGASLRVNGNKTIAVDFGTSQDAFLRQSLDLAVSGTLAPGVQITGVLTDRSVPLTESGATQDLQALDRVLLEVRSPNAVAALGDVDLSLQRSDFARIQRRVQGVRGDFRAGGFSGTVAAASAQGEYHRMQFYGTDGRQGPYALTDRSGRTGAPVVPGSEVVTVDGQRMARGEGADYAIDYGRGEITFSNRRPISSVTRITVDYQYTLNRYRRNLAAADGWWERGPSWLFTRVLAEGDDRGRPLDLLLDETDRFTLSAAGDSAGSAVAPGVIAGTGDYDTVRVGDRLVFAFSGRDSGAFAVSFTRVGAGEGDYADSALASGGTAHRWVGSGAGSWRIGRALPLPESQQVFAVGGGTRAGALSLEVEGAMSRRDLNTASAIDDDDNIGLAGRVRLTLEGAAPLLPGTAGVSVQARGVDRRFAPFDRLERPFAQEDWALPPEADLERQEQVGFSAWLRPGFGGELRGGVSALHIPEGYRALRREGQWVRDGRIATRLVAQFTDGRDDGRRYPEGVRRLLSGDARWRGRWLEPGLRLTADERRSPSDSAVSGGRYREAAAELRSGSALRWRASTGYSLRRDAAAVADGFEERSQTTVARAGLESPTTGALGVALAYEHREVDPLADGPGGSTDLASLRLRGEHAPRGLSGTVGLEVTSEGENARTRVPVFVGPGLGRYDAAGTFVGRGDFDLVLRFEPSLVRLSGSAFSAHGRWQWDGPPALRGSRLELTCENDARRRGEFRPSDALLTPGAALEDSALARASVLYRIEGELAPASRLAAFRLRLERRVSADRAALNYSQSTDQRLGSLRWITRPAAAWTTELESRLQRQSAEQSLSGSAPYRRTLLETTVGGQLVWTPLPGLRAVARAELVWSRPEGAPEAVRTTRFGPDLGFAVGARGRAELSARRSIWSGTPSYALLPGSDSAGLAEWEGNARFDYRVHEIVTCGLSMTYRDEFDRAPRTLGRAEVRAFF